MVVPPLYPAPATSLKSLPLWWLPLKSASTDSRQFARARMWQNASEAAPALLEWRQKPGSTLRSIAHTAKNGIWCARSPGIDSDGKVPFPGNPDQTSAEFRIGIACRAGAGGVESHIRDWRIGKSWDQKLYLINREVLESGEIGRELRILHKGCDLVHGCLGAFGEECSSRQDRPDCIQQVASGFALGHSSADGTRFEAAYYLLGQMQ